MRSIDHHQLVPSACPSEQLWGNYLSGSIELVTLNAMSAHLETCSGCAVVLDALSARSPNVQNAVRSPYLDEPNFIRMVARVEELRVASDAGDTVVDRALRRKDDAEDRAPAIVGRFLVRRVLGAGGFGRVYLATDPLLNRSVAIKAPRHSEFDSEGDLSSFLSEARHAAALDHPGIVPIFDVLADDSGRTLIVMKYIEGESLAARLQKGPLGLEKTVRIMIQVARAMHFAHERGFVHRDLKPANILMDEHGTPHVSDLGLGLNLDQRDEKVLRGGTPAYMSPEQIRHDVIAIDRRSDVWSLGVMLAELVHGRRPFPQKERHELFKAILNDEPLIESAPETKALDVIIWRCLERAPADRFATADLLAEELTLWLRWNYPTGIEKWRYGWRRNVALVSVCFLLSVSTLLVWTQQNRSAVNQTLSQIESAPAKQVSKLVKRLRDSKVVPSFVYSATAANDAFSQFRLDLTSIAVGDCSEATLSRFVEMLMTKEADEVAAAVESIGETDSADAVSKVLLERISQNGLDKTSISLLAAFAGLASSDPAWGAHGKNVAYKLTRLTDDEQSHWIPLFDKIAAQHLVEPLRLFLSDSACTVAERQAAVRALARYLANDFQQLVELTGEVEGIDLPLLLDGLQAQRQLAITCLAEHFNTSHSLPRDVPTNDEAPPSSNDVRSAKFAVALALLDDFEAVCSSLQHDRDPTLQTLVIHGLARQEIAPEKIIDQLRAFCASNELSANAIKFGLLQILAELPVAAVRGRIPTGLLDQLVMDVDGGVHSSAKLVAQRHGIELQTIAPGDYGRWRVEKIAETLQDFAVVEPCAAELGMHGGQTPPVLTDPWVRHVRAFQRRIAIATNEVTIAQFRAFDERLIESMNEIKDPIFLESAPDAAMMLLTLDEAYRFCNWLSAVAGLEPCYEPVEANSQLLRPRPDYLSLPGYRLATDGEWELACRAGTDTSRYFGHADELITKYGWTMESILELARNKTHLSQRTARLLPNRWGLFDMYGNANEFCDMSVEVAESGSLTVDSVLQSYPDTHRITQFFRGVSTSQPGITHSRSHSRTVRFVGGKNRTQGMRVARTLSNSI